MAATTSACVAFAAVLLLCVATHTRAAPEHDRIHSLPGWNQPLPSAMYSGLISSGTAPNGLGGMHQHYWFVECEQSDPSTCPLVVWYNGVINCT